ncbi:hypothetical protein HYFRA_00012359 [Hymenoscyphus fraxineus]|uniref:Uncharacterized protein n=1 Tax=Hymenoscyphus fraxineus TaxID=746836 RepID=A0A9N9L0J7_9HELO|nr:hypothetical protein HYFRA_00012359 [Hymenoscyphus fraxineus]
MLATTNTSTRTSKTPDLANSVNFKITLTRTNSVYNFINFKITPTRKNSVYNFINFINFVNFKITPTRKNSVYNFINFINFVNFKITPTRKNPVYNFINFIIFKISVSHKNDFCGSFGNRSTISPAATQTGTPSAIPTARVLKPPGVALVVVLGLLLLYWSISASLYRAEGKITRAEKKSYATSHTLLKKKCQTTL